MGEFTEEAVIKFGISPLAAYELTPHEISVVGQQAQEKKLVEFENIIALAWHTEAFARQKKLPRLNKLLRDIRKPNNRVSASDTLLKAMAAEKGVKIP